MRRRKQYWYENVIEWLMFPIVCLGLALAAPFVGLGLFVLDWIETRVRK